MKVNLDSKYGEAIGYLVVLVPLFAFLLYIEAVSWLAVLAMLSAVSAICGAFVALSGLFAHRSRVIHLRGQPAMAFWGGCVAAAVGVGVLLCLKAHDTLFIAGAGLAFISILLWAGRRRSIGGA